MRHGLREAVAGGAGLVACCDADFAAPPAEVARLIDTLRADVGLGAVIASRVAMLGTGHPALGRAPHRGRLFATLSSLVLRGAGATPPSAAPRRSGQAAAGGGAVRPFVSQWAFDVELLGRLLRAGASRCRCSPGTTQRERT